MLADKNEYLEYRNDPLETILDIKGLRKTIKEFKVDKAIDVLMGFYEETWTFEKQENSSKKREYSRFTPTAKDIVVAGDTGTHNLGVFSTALCLETISAYVNEVDECKKSTDGGVWVWDKGQNRRRAVSEGDYKENRKKANQRNGQRYGREKAYSYFKFIIEGLYGDLGVPLGFLARVATLVRFGNYLSHWGIKDAFIEHVDEDLRTKFYGICSNCIVMFNQRILTRREGIHPFELFRFLQFVREWGRELEPLINDPKEILEHLAQPHKKESADSVKKLVDEIKGFMVNSGSNDGVLVRYFFDKVYLLAKYELYRQISLSESGDSRLYDAKRLAYALLVISMDNRFSNGLIRTKALELIFRPYKLDRNAVWPTGQQVAISKNGLMIVSDSECASDLLGCTQLNATLLSFIPELKSMFDSYARTKRVSNGKIIGWYPVHQRDQTPTSWTTAFTLSFIQRFCKLLSLELAMRAKLRFRSNYRKPDVVWNNIYDSTAVKSKVRLMFPESYGGRRPDFSSQSNLITGCRYKTAIMFGPPGTGKTTYARALATRLNLDYLELTPGDFFSAGEDFILVTINDIFEHLLHLRNTVVFIDEIDDLVKDRNPEHDGSKSSSEHPYDPRTLFVNSLLPRFQELHDKGNIILLMATNNIERVDKAIMRMGRVDLVIPVGAISPHGRLKFLQKFYGNHRELLSGLEDLSEEDRIDLAVKYLNATEAFNFSTLKHYSGMIIDELKRRQNDGKAARKKIEDLLEAQAKMKKKENTLLIWPDNVIKLGYKYETRPTHQGGDFQDFGYLSLLGYNDTKERFQKDFIRLYFDLQNEEIDVPKAKRIKETITKYCNPFPMQQGKTSEECEGPLFNIMTPFYDDIESAIEKAKGDEGRKALISSLEQVEKLVFCRPMLPE